MTTIRVETVSNMNPSEIANSMCCGWSAIWHNAVDRYNSIGNGIVFIDIDEIEVNDFIKCYTNDERITFIDKQG